MTTWNPSDKDVNVTLTNGNLTRNYGTAGNKGSVRATVSKTSGKWYWEEVVVSVTQWGIGFGASDFSLSNYLGFSGTSCMFWSNGGTFVSGMTAGTTPSGWGVAANDVFGIAIDLDAGKAWISRNGTWAGTGNPATGANPWVTFTAGTALFPAGSMQDAASSTLRPTAASQTYTAPTGFSAWDAAAGGATVAPSTGSVSITGQQPTVRTPRNVTPSTGSVSISGNAPTAQTPRSVAPSTGSVAITGQQPSIQTPRNAAPSTGSITITGNAPSIQTPRNITPSTGSVSIAGNAPTVQTPSNVSPSTGSITIAGQQPTVSGDQNANATPATGSVVVTGNAPAVLTPVIVGPSTGSVGVSGNSPSVLTPRAISPKTGVIEIFNGQPVVTNVSVSSNVTPRYGTVAVSGYAPTVKVRLRELSSVGRIRELSRSAHRRRLVS